MTSTAWGNLSSAKKDAYNFAYEGCLCTILNRDKYFALYTVKTRNVTNYANCPHFKVFSFTCTTFFCHIGGPFVLDSVCAQLVECKLYMSRVFAASLHIFFFLHFEFLKISNGWFGSNFDVAGRFNSLLVNCYNSCVYVILVLKSQRRFFLQL